MLFNYWNLIVVTPNLFVGGAEKVAVTLANEAISDFKDGVLLISLNGAGDLKNELDDGVTFIDLKSVSPFHIILKLVVFLLFNRGNVISCQRFTNVYVGLSTYFSKKRKVLFREASTLDALFEGSKIKRYIKITLMKISYRRCSWLVANSEDTKLDLLDKAILPKHKCRVIGNPVIPSNVEIKKYESVKHKWFGGDYKIILNVGRLEMVKDQSIIIDALKTIISIDDTYRLIFIGDGALKGELLSKALDLNLTSYIDFISFTDNVFKYMQKSNVYVSSSKWEGFGNTIVEALSCGLPVVGFSCPGGARELIENDSLSALLECRQPTVLAHEIISSTISIDSKVENQEMTRYNCHEIYTQYRELFTRVY